MTIFFEKRPKIGNTQALGGVARRRGRRLGGREAPRGRRARELPFVPRTNRPWRCAFRGVPRFTPVTFCRRVSRNSDDTVRSNATRQRTTAGFPEHFYRIRTLESPSRDSEYTTHSQKEHENRRRSRRGRRCSLGAWRPGVPTHRFGISSNFVRECLRRSRALDDLRPNRRLARLLWLFTTLSIVQIGPATDRRYECLKNQTQIETRRWEP